MLKKRKALFAMVLVVVMLTMCVLPASARTMSGTSSTGGAVMDVWYGKVSAYTYVHVSSAYLAAEAIGYDCFGAVRGSKREARTANSVTAVASATAIDRGRSYHSGPSISFTFYTAV